MELRVVLFWFCFCFFFCKKCLGNINFYISQQEALRLLGMSAELHYIRDGIVYTVAQHFLVPVPSHIGELCFVWEAPADKPVKYSIVSQASNLLAMKPPTLNITSSGFVPKTSQIFCLFLPCTFHVTAPVDVSMRVNLSLPAVPNNITSINIMLRKNCSTEVLSHVLPVDDPSYMVYVTVGITTAILVIVLAALAICCCPKQNFFRGNASRSGAENGAAVYSPVRTTSNSEGAVTVLVSDSLPPETDGGNSELRSVFQRKNVSLGTVLLEGTFGCVYKGTLRTPNNKTTNIIIKTVKENAAETQAKLMIKEGTRFQKLEHYNLYSIVAVIDDVRPMLVYPPVNQGNLKKWLLHCRGSLEGSLPHPLCTQDLVSMALHILQGIQFLHQNGIVHKDLATRNCVIDDEFHVKVTDTALSRDLFPNDYHCLGDNENRPIRWMALESLTKREFTFASDIWSFGVILWEVTTLAQQPYVEVDPFEMATFLRGGYRLSQPVNCPDELFAIMAYCWTSSPEDRPHASQLYRELHKFHRQLNEYI